MAFHHIGVREILVRQVGVVAGFDGFVIHLLVEIATGQAIPVGRGVGVQVNQPVVDFHGFVQPPQAVIGVGHDAHEGFVVLVFANAGLQPFQRFLGVMGVDVHVGHADHRVHAFLVADGAEHLLGLYVFALEDVYLCLDNLGFSGFRVQVVDDFLGAVGVMVVQEEVGFLRQQCKAGRVQLQAVFHDLHGHVRLLPHFIPVGQVGQVVRIHVDVSVLGFGVLVLFGQFRQFSVSSR